MKRLYLSFFTVILLFGCGRLSTVAPPAADHPDAKLSLAEARRGFQTKLTRKESSGEPVDVPPPSVFRIVRYPASSGQLQAYLSPDPKDGKKHPAVVWMTGGDCNTIGDVWKRAPASNDQSARAFREAGIVMMFPSLRGGNTNPGFREGFFGEVDDVIAATEYLSKQEFVDPSRIYLGGHSTGGTLVLLVAASSELFRAVFSFGPVDDVSGYGSEFLPFDTSNPREIELRSPIRWLHSIKSPTFVFEGTSQGNFDALNSLSKSCTNTKVHFQPMKGANHFNLLDPTTRLLAKKILADDGPSCTIAVTEAELSGR